MTLALLDTVVLTRDLPESVIGDAIVDFAARSARLVVEIDGDAYHAGRTSADARCDTKLRARGWRVLRLPASLVERRLGEAVALLRAALGR